MSCITNISVSHPILSSNLSLFTSNPILLHPRSMDTSISCRRKAIKSMAAQGNDNLGQLERANKQQQPNKRSASVAPIGLWDMFPSARTMQQMMETMDRMMEEPFGYVGKWPDSFGNGRGRTPWEIKEAETEYKMRFDMPGMTKQDVKVWVEDKMLVITAEKQAKDGEEWAVKSYGRYSSRITLPDNVQLEKIKAEVKDGVLYISVPKAAGVAQVFDINVV
ncbi:small heat shock protein, chloroplastic-like [Primulina huaijiensis]|uniref:small heat shock protein, chloroplastic-like n=1 Tax=Primulina huaijiensis TaxID=1492673 RepID=UPI003CC71174